MQAISDIQKQLNAMTITELVQVWDNLFVSPIIKNDSQLVEYIIPDVVLHQIDDWKIYAMYDDEKIKLENSDLIYKNENNNLIFMRTGATFQYVMLRVKTTPIRNSTEIEKLTKQVNELTKMVNELTKMVNELTKMVNELTKMVNELKEDLNFSGKIKYLNAGIAYSN